MKDLITLKTMFRQLGGILDPRQRKHMVGMIFVIMLGSMLEMLGVSIVLPFIQALLTPEELGKKRYIAYALQLFNLPSSSSNIVLISGIGIIVFYLLKNGYLLLSTYLQAVYSANTRKSISNLLMKSYMGRSYSFFTNTNSGEIINGVIHDANSVYNFIQNLFKFMSEMMNILLIGIYLAYTDLYMSLGLIVTAVISLMITVFGIKKYISKLGQIARKANIIASKWIVQIVEGIKDIFVFESHDYFYDNYDEAYKANTQAAAAQNFVAQCPERFIEFFCISGMIVTVLVRLGSGEDPTLFVPKLAVFAMGAFRLLPSVSRTTGYISQFIYVRPAIEASYENVKAARNLFEERSKIVKELDNEKQVVFSDRIDINNISWHYDGSESKDVLQDFSLTIKKGETVGIIGESGSGKSTLADILLNLYVPQEGSIFMDGMDINTIPHSWHANIGYVPQSIFLLDGSVRDNVAFGAGDIDEDKVWESLRQADLDRFVRELPKGLDTVVGEHGVKFSGGQRQRIAIARALYYDPQILLLDEATSALDNDTETTIMDAVDSLKGKMTLIIIAHRLTTLRNCDRIIEISDGKAIQRDKRSVIEGI